MNTQLPAKLFRDTLIYAEMVGIDLVRQTSLLYNSTISLRLPEKIGIQIIMVICESKCNDPLNRL
jgi:hypothetical protein